ncbi:OmpA family protein [Roseobacteraceae bacterium S113]
MRNPAARDQVLARIGDLPEGYTLVSDGITLLDDGTPPVFDLTKGADGAVAAMGKLPEGVSQTDLAEALGAAAITGTAKPGFVGSNDGPAALVAAGALGQLNEGLLRFDDGQIVLSGVAANPDVTTAIEDALAQLPALYEVDTSAVTLADDGRPVGFEIAFNATAGAEVTGKLPEGLDAAALGAALGLPAMGGDAATSFIGGDQSDGILAQLSGLKPWMAITETAILTYGPDGLDVDIATVLGADTALVRDGIAAEIDGAQVRVSQASAIGADGRTRVNIVTGVNERVSNGFWLPDVRFEANPESCTSRSQDVLAAAKINFVTGSASLDPLSVSTVNRIASIVQRCVIEGGLRAEIGGHTDNTGNAQDNFQLSFERARAVEQALVVRGVPGQGMQSVGHGDTQPVASNDTDAGRAANRRTSIVWTNIAQ